VPKGVDYLSPGSEAFAKRQRVWQHNALVGQICMDGLKSRVD